ncbi:uncharacterized protein SAPINGB_P005256 [Magnusiomyces paraingens]|uniref:Proline dehydrogenase n=1 Tax=Magnusiomyces paraingens TaxID=2606893 RepID=A0A5E8C4L3_9ASCO|nr:uncharacterized protein SAPINGB_P005256 [Saprochaete ingens]VVT56768.1 unnamed protein product [Saprochaete ingens]
MSLLRLQAISRVSARTQVIRMASPAINSRLISSSSIKKAATTNPQALEDSSSSPQLSDVKIIDSTKPPQFLKSLAPMDLFCYTLIAAATANPALIRLSTNVMRYVPKSLIKTFVYPIYCGGETFDEVVATGSKLLKRGFGNMMISYSVEDAEGEGANALLDEAVAEIVKSIDEVLVKHVENVEALYEKGEVSQPPISGYVALKPTGLMPNSALALQEWNNPKYADLWEEYLATCRAICQHALDHGKGKVVIMFDAEKKILQPGVYAAQRAMMKEFNRNGNVIVMGTIQMYLQDSRAQLASDLADAKEHGYQLALKLVRGAYVHSEPDRWNVVHKTKADTDASYNGGVSEMLSEIESGWRAKKPSAVGRLIVASHNEESMSRASSLLKAAQSEGIIPEGDESVVFGQLMGMAEDQGEALARRGHKVIKYVPWGPAKETKEYLVRRLEENGDTVSVGGWAMAGHGLAEIARRVFGRM